MSQTEFSISESIRHSLVHVRKHSNMTVWNTARLPTQAEEAHRQKQVEAICDRMESLAERSETDDTRYPDYDELRRELAALGSYPLNEDVAAIARAFHQAERLDRK